MDNLLLAMIAKHQLQIQWENPNESADEFMEPDDKEPCTLIITSANGTSWSSDYEDSEEGRNQVLQQFLLEAQDLFSQEDDEFIGETLSELESRLTDPEDASEAPLDIDED